jgi:hypothetical protein
MRSLESRIIVVKSHFEVPTSNVIRFELDHLQKRRSPRVVPAFQRLWESRETSDRAVNGDRYSFGAATSAA